MMTTTGYFGWEGEDSNGQHKHIDGLPFFFIISIRWVPYGACHHSVLYTLHHFPVIFTIFIFSWKIFFIFSPSFDETCISLSRTCFLWSLSFIFRQLFHWMMLVRENGNKIRYAACFYTMKRRHWKIEGTKGNGGRGKAPLNTNIANVVLHATRKFAGREVREACGLEWVTKKKAEIFVCLLLFSWVSFLGMHFSFEEEARSGCGTSYENMK